LGYQVDVCDSNSFCLGRFSRFVRGFYRCPAWAENPRNYLEFIFKLIELGQYAVLLPVHDQAFLFSAARDQLTSKVGIALTEFRNFALLQSKATFAQLVESLGLPHPPTRLVQTSSQLEAMDNFPYYVKAPYSTAGRGVWRINNLEERSAAISVLDKQGLLRGGTDIVVQGVAEGLLSHQRNRADFRPRP
jgi:predicted ATP-grasp superfamily ATP-dependent carboligase